MPARKNPRYCHFGLLSAIIFRGFCDAALENQARQQVNSPNSSLRVAIVGSGVTGASAAFHLHELSRSAPISVTIYESESTVGGRVVSVSVPETGLKVVEAGASSLFVDDDCLTGGLAAFGLEFQYRIPWERPRTVGLWNGQNILAGPSCNLDSPTWLDLAYLIARYGISAWRFHRKVVSTSKMWKSFGASRPFHNIGDALKDADLGEDLFFDSAETYFQGLGISSRFLYAFVEPCARARFSQNLANISAFSALMAARKAKESSVRGGNVQLIERMINFSRADLRLNSTVIGISDGVTHRYQLSVVSTPLQTPPSVPSTEYDVVILASPFHGIRMNISNFHGHSKSEVLDSDSQLHAESHVTHFSTSAPLSPSFFNTSLNTSFPYDLLTTANSFNILSTSQSDVCYKRFCDPGDQLDECDQCDDDDIMHRVESRQRLSNVELANLIGKQRREGQGLDDLDITWVHRQAWSSAQQTLRKDKNSDEGSKIEIAPNLFSSGGRGWGIDSMEMSCKMGRNIARLFTRSDVDEMYKSHLEL